MSGLFGMVAWKVLASYSRLTSGSQPQGPRRQKGGDARNGMPAARSFAFSPLGPFILHTGRPHQTAEK